MRVVKCAGLAVAALLLASVASAQGIGDVAAREKEKRKGPKPAKVYTESDLGSASSAVPAPVVEAAAPADAAKPGEAKPAEAKPGDKDAEKAAAEAAAKAQEDWKNRLGQARAEETAIQGTIDRLQASLSTGAGIYSPGWTAAMANLDDAKKKLVDVQDRIASLLAEGQRAGYR
jgi:hypothetical protein